MGNIRRAKHGAEWFIQRDLVTMLRDRGWYVERMIGNAFQMGIPDLFLAHLKWGQRWVDVKRPGSKYSFTKAQKIKWPVWESFNIGIWILTGADQENYDRLFHAPNWRDYAKESWRIPTLTEIDALLDAIE